MMTEFNKLADSLEMSRTELANTLGVHYMTLQKWATGERRPSAATVRLVRALVWLCENHPDEYNDLLIALEDIESQQLVASE